MSSERGRYSKVSRRIWNSPSFKGLTQPKPCGAWLFFRLLTGPELSNIPGLFQAWDAGLARALGWAQRDFDKAFAEVLKSGMAHADWDVGLVWLPSAIHHNEPESVNVVVGWRTAWQELPECMLKASAHAALMSWALAKGEAWWKALEKATGKPSVKASPKPTSATGEGPSPIQEQEQEQEQKKNQPPTAEGFAMHPAWQPHPDTWAGFEAGLIPRWAAEALVAKHRSHFSAAKSDIRSDEAWNQSCSKWVHGDWNNPAKRPKKPEADPGSGGAIQLPKGVRVGAEGM